MTLSEDRQRLLAQLIRRGSPPRAAAALTPVSSSPPSPPSSSPPPAPSRPTSSPPTDEGTGTIVEPASFAQRRLWFVEQLQQTEVPYTLHAIEHLRFAVDAERLQRAIDAIVARHDILRTSFRLEDGEPVQCVTRTAHVPLAFADLSGIAAGERQPELLLRLGAIIGKRFDLATSPLLRAALFKLGEQEFVMLLAVHHIVFDGPSFHVFFQELEAHYSAYVRDAEPALRPVSAQYPQFSREQRARLTPARIATEVEFWRGELANLPMLDLPLDRPRAPVPSFRGEHRLLGIAAERVSELQRRAAAEKTSLFTVSLAAFFAAMARVCGQDDFAIGLPVTGRDSKDREHAIGFFVDTLVVRARLDGDPTASELVARTHAALHRSLAHGALPFEMLVQHVAPARSFGVNPFFQVGYQLMLHPAMTPGGAQFDVERSSAMFDLALDMWMQDKTLAGRLQFNTDLFESATISLLMSAFEQALAWICEPASPFSAFSLATRPGTDAPSALQGERRDFGAARTGALLTDVAARHPDAVAFDARCATITYRELRALVDERCEQLRARGARPGQCIALEQSRSRELALMQLAALELGVPFVTIDPAWPAERRAHIRALIERTPDPGSIPNADTAYVIFTSGSTGVPKGVAVSDAGLANVVHAQRQTFGLGPGRRVGLLASPSFDASIFELVLALGSGATCVVAPPEILAGAELAAFIERNRIDSVVLPPSVLATMQPHDCPGLRLVCVAGESCPADLATTWSEGRDFWNLYGPTEATIWATAWRYEPGARVNIGRPIANLTSLIVDPEMRPVPAGVPGELCVAGVGVAQGYLAQPELTAQKFVDGIPGAPGRAYRTGDRARQLASGKLVFLGRVDRQVKVRGFRIEPEDIERVLRLDPSVTAAIVDARHAASPESVLVAWLQSADDARAVAERCRRLVLEHLPQHMLPAHFFVLADFPRTASGKLDVAALPSPADQAAAADEYVEPATQTERSVAELMSRVVHVARIGAAHDFFHVGGHSLAAAQLASRASTAFGVDVTIRDVFVHSTVAALATRIDELRSASAGGAMDDDDVPLVRLPRAGDHAGHP